MLASNKGLVDCNLVHLKNFVLFFSLFYRRVMQLPLVLPVSPLLSGSSLGKVLTEELE